MRIELCWNKYRKTNTNKNLRMQIWELNSSLTCTKEWPLNQIKGLVWFGAQQYMLIYRLVVTRQHQVRR
jgi:hypothetical protein